MLEENRPEVLRMEIESLSRNEEFARVVVSVFMARMNPTLEELDDVKTGIPNIVQAMEPMFTTDPEGERSGMGFSFMEAFMDEVRVESEPDKGTVVTMKKKING